MTGKGPVGKPASRKPGSRLPYTQKQPVNRGSKAKVKQAPVKPAGRTTKLTQHGKGPGRTAKTLNVHANAGPATSKKRGRSRPRRRSKGMG